MIIQSFQLFTSKKLKTLWINKKFTQTIKTRCGKSDAIISCKGFDCMKKLLAISSILLTVCTAFASCGNNDNSYSAVRTINVMTVTMMMNTMMLMMTVLLILPGVVTPLKTTQTTLSTALKMQVKM